MSTQAKAAPPSFVVVTMRAEQQLLSESRVFRLMHCRYPSKLRYRIFHRPIRELIWRKACE